jgi:hypothetical protein
MFAFDTIIVSIDAKLTTVAAHILDLRSSAGARVGAWWPAV